MTGSVREQASTNAGFSAPKSGSSSEAVFMIWGSFGVKELPRHSFFNKPLECGNLWRLFGAPL